MRSAPFRTSKPLSPWHASWIRKVRGWIALPALWLDRNRSRHDLRDLSAEQLRDVGLNVETVRVEARKPFWQA